MFEGRASLLGVPERVRYMLRSAGDGTFRPGDVARGRWPAIAAAHDFNR
jgi:hypothetical protein